MSRKVELTYTGLSRLLVILSTVYGYDRNNIESSNYLKIRAIIAIP